MVFNLISTIEPNNNWSLISLVIKVKIKQKDASIAGSSVQLTLNSDSCAVSGSLALLVRASLPCEKVHVFAVFAKMFHLLMDAGDSST
jgi:hypothetical protein